MADLNDELKGKQKILTAFEQEKKNLQEEILNKDQKLQKLNEQELSLRKEKNQLEEDRKALELDIQRRLDAERKIIEDRARNSEVERFKLKEAEYQKELTEKTEHLQRLSEQELMLRKEKSQLEEQRKSLELDVQRRLDVEKKKIEEQVRRDEAEVFKAKEAEYQSQIAEKAAHLQKLSEQELVLRKEKSQLEEDRKNLELDVQRKLDTEKKKIEEQTRNIEADRFKLKEAELQKKIEDAQKSNEELRRKLEQGSQQLQGEVLELEIEGLLKAAFPFDTIEPVRKGVRGADVVQTVLTRMGEICGKIVWEAKRAENWSNTWIPKLKDNQQAANAEIAVLITTVMPKQTKEAFFMMDDVWVVDISAVRPLAETLRVLLVETHKHKLIDLNKNEKMEALYLYLCSPQFVQKVRSVVDAFTSMKKELDSEKAAMMRLWKKREAQIDRVTQNMMGMCGELQAIAQNSIPQLEDIGGLPVIEDASSEAMPDEK